MQKSAGGSLNVLQILHHYLRNLSLSHLLASLHEETTPPTGGTNVQEPLCYRRSHRGDLAPSLTLNL